jgi:hypothetical protein
MSLADIECTEVDPYIVDLVVTERLKQLGHRLNYAEKREVIARLQGTLGDPELGRLIGLSTGAVLKIRIRQGVPA